LIREFAAAKVNLALRVGALRDDGYHPVDSIVVFADWGDALSVAPADDLSLCISGPQAEGLSPGDDNLVIRAVRALATAAGREVAGSITLEKHIPAGAGLGGGSADAAAALRALNRFWELEWPLDMLAGIGAEIGSDVPACVWSQPLRMTGRGERIRPIDAWPDFPALLVNPRLPVATGPVFAAFDKMPAGSGAAFRPTTDTGRAAILESLRAATNDLTDAAMSVQPVIRDVLDTLGTTGEPDLVRMSGSGATCFAIYPTASHRDAAATSLQAKRPDWLVQPVVFSGASAITPA
jgi:4-diphosphocytidyl-2-C-methyl-D-erythritol kinase